MVVEHKWQVWVDLQGARIMLHLSNFLVIATNVDTVDSMKSKDKKVNNRCAIKWNVLA